MSSPSPTATAVISPACWRQSVSIPNLLFDFLFDVRANFLCLPFLHPTSTLWDGGYALKGEAWIKCSCCKQFLELYTVVGTSAELGEYSSLRYL